CPRGRPFSLSRSVEPGERPSAHRCGKGVFGMSARDERLLELLERWCEAEARGEPLTTAELCADCPELAADLQIHIDMHRQLDRLAESPLPAGPWTTQPHPAGGHHPAGAASLVPPPPREAEAAGPSIDPRATVTAQGQTLPGPA